MEETEEEEALDEELEGDLQYWARKKSRELHEELCGRIDAFYRETENSIFMEELSRNWCYYYGLFRGYDDFQLLGSAIQRAGPKGERSFMGLNHFRNLLQHLHILTVRDRPAPKTVAINADADSLMDAQVVDAVLEDYLRQKRLESYLTRATEHGIVLTKGYVTLEWDTSLGKAVKGLRRPGKPGLIQREGDVRFRNPTILDVVRDREVTVWQENQWVIVRDWPNKYDLAAQFPKKARKILNSSEPRESLWGCFNPESMKTDRVARWTFYHERTPSMPVGRAMRFTRGCWLEDGRLPDIYEKIPVYQVMPSEVLLTGEGWSPGFDLQGPQEALNMTVSNILTNHDAFGIQNIFSPQGNNLKEAQLSGGLRVLQGKVAPTPLQFTANAPDAYQFLEALVKHMEYLSGINGVIRGQPETVLKSGKALSIVEAKAVQFASGLIAGHYQLTEEVLTSLVRILARGIGSHSRMTEVAGKFGRTLRKTYDSERLQRIDRVTVQMVDPVSKTLSGKMELAEKFIALNWVKTPEEVTQVLLTGRLDPLLQADQAMLGGLAAERDALLEGKQVPVLKTDYHSLHIRECFALLNTPEIRMDDAKSAVILAHGFTHILMLYLPDTRDVQLAQGYQVPELSPAVLPGLIDEIDPSTLQENFRPDDLAFFESQLMGQAKGAGASTNPPQKGAAAPRKVKLRSETPPKPKSDMDTEAAA